MIQYYHLKSLCSINIKAKLDTTLGESASSLTTIKYLVTEFKQGCTTFQNEHRSDRPNEVTTPEMTKRILKIVLDDRRLKVREISDMVSISKIAVLRILAENLDVNSCKQVNGAFAHNKIKTAL